MPLSESGDLAGRLERFAGDVLNQQPSEQQVNELGGLAKQAEALLHSQVAK